MWLARLEHWLDWERDRVWILHEIVVIRIRYPVSGESILETFQLPFEGFTLLYVALCLEVLLGVCIMVRKLAGTLESAADAGMRRLLKMRRLITLAALSMLRVAGAHPTTSNTTLAVVLGARVG